MAQFCLARVESDDESPTDASDEEIEANTCESLMGHIHRGASSRRILSVVEKEAGVDRRATAFRRNILLSISTGFWVAVFGLPMYELSFQDLIFGQRDMVTSPLIKEMTESAHGFARNSFERAMILKQMARLKVSCGRTDTGRMRNIAPESHYPHLKSWDKSMSPWDETNINDFWCGFLPKTYLNYWPNVAQLIVFTVYKNTGTAVNYAWQGLIGTALAGLNLHVMTWIFPFGAAAQPCLADAFTVLRYDSGWMYDTAENRTAAEGLYDPEGADLKAVAIFDPYGMLLPEWCWFQSWDWRHKTMAKQTMLTHQKCDKTSKAYKDPNYASSGPAVCLLDVFLVLFLFLFSCADRNTKLYGIAWHLVFMMEFMNPEQGVIVNPQWEERLGSVAACYLSSTAFVCLSTTLAGVCIAVIATLIPTANLYALGNLYNDSRSLTFDTLKIWEDCVQYLGGCHQTADRFEIEKQIEALPDTASNIRDNLKGAWWETLGIGKRGKTRMLLEAFDTNVVDITHLLIVIKNCVHGQAFGEEHNKFWSIIRQPIEDLCIAVANLRWLCLEACKDGIIEPHEVRQIEAFMEEVVQSKTALKNAYEKTLPMMEELSDDYLFVFVFSVWVQKTQDLAKVIVEAEDNLYMTNRQKFKDLVLTGLYATWSPSVCLTYAHIMYVARNFTAIALGFLVGYFISGTIFTPYSVTMATTLVYLTPTDATQWLNLEKMMKRIAGVSLGKILPPAITTWVLIYFPCSSFVRTSFQGLIIWVYTGVSMYIYLSGTMWSYIGYLCCAFGIYQLLQPCYRLGDQEYFAFQYQQLGQVIFAILLQSFVYSFLSKTSERKKLVQHLGDASEALVNSFEAISKGDLVVLQDLVASACADIDRCKAYMLQCDPKLEVFPCGTEPFNMELCRATLASLEAICGELGVFQVATNTWVANQPVLSREISAVSSKGHTLNILEYLNSTEVVRQVEARLHNSMVDVASVLPKVFEPTHPDKLAWDAQLEQFKQTYKVAQAAEVADIYVLYGNEARARAAQERLAPTPQVACAQMDDDDFDLTLMSKWHLRAIVAVRSLQICAEHIATIRLIIMRL